MDEGWREIFRNHMESYKAIETLQNNGLMDEEERSVYEHNLLVNILADIKEESECEEYE